MDATRQKPRVSLVPADAFLEVVRVLTRGEEKHGAAGWRLRTSDDYYDAAMRHALASRSARLARDEEGYIHLACASANLLLALAIELLSEKPS